MFDTLSDRLETVFKSLRGKGRLSEADIDATAREIRIALLEADVALPVVREFIAAIKERARGAEVSQALNPAQQVIKIVNEELVAILGGQTRPLQLAKTPPTVIMLAGLQGSGKTTLAGSVGGSRNSGTSRCSSQRTCSDPTPCNSCKSSAGRSASTCGRRTPAAASAIRSTRRVRRSSTLDGWVTTSSSSTPRGGSASTRR